MFVLPSRIYLKYFCMNELLYRSVLAMFVLNLFRMLVDLELIVSEAVTGWFGSDIILISRFAQVVSIRLSIVLILYLAKATSGLMFIIRMTLL